MDRRKFIVGGSAAVATFMAGDAMAQRKKKACPLPPVRHNLETITPALADINGGRPPNILMVFTDQERYHGNLPSTLKRPNFDRLLSNSVTFDNAYCAYPLCSPSRSAVFSGKYPHQTGVTQNIIFPAGKESLDINGPHIGSVLASAGYRIAYKGKWDLSRGPDYYKMNPRDRGRAGHYGYEGHCGDVPDQEYGYIADEQVVDESCAWIREQKKDEPWFLCCSIINPHDICHPRLMPGNSIRPDAELPESFHDDLLTKPSRQLKTRWGLNDRILNMFFNYGKAFNKFTDQDWLQFISFYYDLIEETDNHLGRLFNALEATGLLDNTVIVYHSDHGELGGAHGLHGKYQGYEEAIHIPLHFYHPAFEKLNIDSFVSNVSIGPTLASLAGVKWPGAVPGKDLSGWMNGKDCARDDYAVSEIEAHTNIMGVFRENYTTRYLVTDNWKYSRSMIKPYDGQLYDLDADPAEMNNLFNDPAHRSIRNDLEGRLKAWQKETEDLYAFPD